MAKPVAGFNVNKQNINKNGRPPEPWTMTGLYKEALEESNETGISKKVLVAQKLVALALKGDVVAIKELGNRIDGMPQQKTDVTTGGEKLEGLVIIRNGGEEK